MNIYYTGAALVFGLALATPAWATPGQCSLTGFGTFGCEVETDGGGLTFNLPDGQTFAFFVTDENEGQGYRLPDDAAPGQRPVELGAFAPVAEEAGCWQSLRNDTKFCVLVEE